jgi:hypothetical protein
MDPESSPFYFLPQGLKAPEWPRAFTPNDAEVNRIRGNPTASSTGLGDIMQLVTSAAEYPYAAGRPLSYVRPDPAAWDTWMAGLQPSQNVQDLRDVASLGAPTKADYGPYLRSYWDRMNYPDMQYGQLGQLLGVNDIPSTPQLPPVVVHPLARPRR